MSVKVNRGQCSVCRYRYPLRKDGTVQGHHGYHGHTPAPECEGSRKPPWPFGPDKISEELAQVIREALAAAERGETVDLGSFAQYADDNGPGDERDDRGSADDN